MQLTSIGKMFSSELTLASAWIHLLVVDLFAARSSSCILSFYFLSIHCFSLRLIFCLFSYFSDSACGSISRHIFHDGLENQIETRHSVSFCLFFCPIGILTHVITKAMTKTTPKEGHGL